MTDAPSHPDPRHDDNALDLGALIRCAADDSLSMEQADALRAHLAAHPEDQARIDFERGLRDATASAMNTGSAPAELREAINNMIASEAPTVGPVETRTRAFWQRTFLPVALAAMILLAFGATLLMTNSPQQTPSGWDSGLNTQVVGWVEREHNKCSESEDYRKQKLPVTNVAEVRNETQRTLGKAPHRIQLDDAGYTLAGYGPCHIPGGGPSGQLIYTPNDGNGKPISLFIQRDDGQLDNVAGTGECIKGATSQLSAESKAGRTPCDQIFIWRADGLIYYMVTGQGNPAIPCLKSLGAPDDHIAL